MMKCKNFRRDGSLKNSLFRDSGDCFETDSGCGFFAYSWKLPAYSGAVFTYSWQFNYFSFSTYSWSFFGYSFSFFTYSWSFFAYSGKVRLIRALRDCKQRSSTVSEKALTVSKKASPYRNLSENFPRDLRKVSAEFPHSDSDTFWTLRPEDSWRHSERVFGILGPNGPRDSCQGRPALQQKM